MAAIKALLHHHIDPLQMRCKAAGLLCKCRLRTCNILAMLKGHLKHT